MLYQALQYPFRGKGSFRHILILALVQLVPIVGHLILLGYGFDIVRALYAGCYCGYSYNYRIGAVHTARIVRLRDLFTSFMVHVRPLRHKHRDT
jgi:hypothetical protein